VVLKREVRADVDQKGCATSKMGPETDKKVGEESQLREPIAIMRE
jgi:hypothetical protein